MKKIIYIAILASVLASCQKPKDQVINVPPKPNDLIGRTFDVWEIVGFDQQGTFYDFGRFDKNRGSALWQLSFKDSAAGLYYCPDHRILDENGKQYPNNQKIGCYATEMSGKIRFVFPSPNIDLWVTQDLKLPTQFLSGNYTITREEVYGQDGYVLTKKDVDGNVIMTIKLVI